MKKILIGLVAMSGLVLAQEKAPIERGTFEGIAYVVSETDAGWFVDGNKNVTIENSLTINSTFTAGSGLNVTGDITLNNGFTNIKYLNEQFLSTKLWFTRSYSYPI